MKVDFISNSPYKTRQINFGGVEDILYTAFDYKYMSDISSDGSRYDAYWDGWKFGISGRDEAGMRDLGEYFSDDSTEYLNHVCKEAGMDEQEKEKFIDAVHKVQQEKQAKTQRLAALVQKGAVSESNITNQKNNLYREFIQFLGKSDEELYGTENYPIPNGVILYGPSSRKNDIADWIPQKANEKGVVAVSKSFDFDEREPLKSLRNLIMEIKNNDEDFYGMANKRILLTVNNIDSLLKPSNDKEVRNAQAIFKNLMGDCARKYHTTIIAVSDIANSSDFESSVTGAQRFKKIYLQDVLSESEQQEILQIKEYLENLKKKCLEASDKFKVWETR